MSERKIVSTIIQSSLNYSIIQFTNQRYNRFYLRKGTAETQFNHKPPIDGKLKFINEINRMRTLSFRMKPIHLYIYIAHTVLPFDLLF